MRNDEIREEIYSICSYIYIMAQISERTLYDFIARFIAIFFSALEIYWYPCNSFAFDRFIVT